jgi:ferredoxin
MIACEVFDQNEEGLVVLLDDDPPETVRNRVRQAAQNCPTRVISLTE